MNRGSDGFFDLLSPSDRDLENRSSKIDEATSSGWCTTHFPRQWPGGGRRRAQFLQSYVTDLISRDVTRVVGHP